VGNLGAEEVKGQADPVAPNYDGYSKKQRRILLQQDKMKRQNRVVASSKK